MQHFTFGSMNLPDGLSSIMLPMATFAITEAFLMVLKRQGTTGVFKEQNLASAEDKKQFGKGSPFSPSPVFSLSLNEIESAIVGFWLVFSDRFRCRRKR